MTATSNFLAFDLGASSGRAVLGAFDGQRLQIEEIHRFPNAPAQIFDHLYWDAPRLFEEIKTGLGKCARKQKQLDGIGLDTWGVDYGLLTKTGELLGLPYHYRDARTRGMMEKAFACVPRAEMYARTGIQFMALNTVFQLLADAASDPQKLDYADTLLFMPNLLNYWLSGVKAAEFSIASTSQMFDVAKNEWVADLLEKLCLPPRILPPVAPSGSIVGELLPQICAETGLSATQIIAPACHDTACAVAAVPAMGETWAYISSGTWSLIGVELPAPVRTPEALQENFTNEGGVGGTVRFLKNMTGLWLVQECVRTWEREAVGTWECGNVGTENADHADGGKNAGDGASSGAKGVSFEELMKLAHDAKPLVSFIDPDDPRFGEPGDMPARIREFCKEKNQPVPESRGAVVRCALESLALKSRIVLNALERLARRKIETVHIVGGGVRNELLCQFTANALGRPVVAGPIEATAIGNVLVQALAKGRIASLREIRKVVARSFQPRHYEPRDAGAWTDAVGRFQALL